MKLNFSRKEVEAIGKVKRRSSILAWSLKCSNEMLGRSSYNWTTIQERKREKKKKYFYAHPCILYLPWNRIIRSDIIESDINVCKDSFLFSHYSRNRAKRSWELERKAREGLSVEKKRYHVHLTIVTLLAL